MWQKFNHIYSIQGHQQLAENIKRYHYDPQISYGLQRITDIHLDPLTRSAGSAEAGVINGSRPVYSIMFLVISGFILLMASVNFINISIAGSLKRSKEVGVRKISGASSSQIIFQFLMESAILITIAFILSVVFMMVLFPLFNQLTAKGMFIAEALNTSVFIYFILLFLILIAATGTYPALVLSRFRAAEVLYHTRGVPGKSVFGKSLIIIQFVPAIILLLAAIVYYQQMNYVNTKNLGYNPQHVIRTGIYGDRDYVSITRYLKNELSRIPAIQTVSFTGFGSSFFLEVNHKNLKAFHKSVDENYIPALEIPMLLGHNFPTGFTPNYEGAIVNETFVKAAGLGHPLGARITLGEFGNKTKIITGVMKDHHFASLRVPIAPMILFTGSELSSELWIKADKAKTKEAISALENIYKRAMPEAIFQYDFLDELNAREFTEEQRWQKIIGISTLLSLLICCMGLFGLAHISTYQRIKEIGIRKVLGATVSQIIFLLSGKFIKLVLISFAVAAPVAWILMNGWLNDFAYRIHIGAGIFITAAGITVFVAMLAVIIQSLRSAWANPAKSLRTD